MNEVFQLLSGVGEAEFDVFRNRCGWASGRGVIPLAASASSTHPPPHRHPRSCRSRGRCDSALRLLAWRGRRRRSSRPCPALYGASARLCAVGGGVLDLVAAVWCVGRSMSHHRTLTGGGDASLQCYAVVVSLVVG